MDTFWKTAGVLFAIGAGLYVRMWLLKSQGQAVHFPGFRKR